MRKYEPAWLQLKRTKQITLIASPSLHKRIVVAIKKEKWRDEEWRDRLAASGRWAKLRRHSQGNILTVTLDISL